MNRAVQGCAEVVQRLCWLCIDGVEVTAVTRVTKLQWKKKSP